MGMGGAAPLLPQAQQWSTLEDQMGEGPLLSSAWSLPPGDGNAKQGTLQRAAARAWGALAAGSAEISALARADPRKPMFAAKVALAITLMSMLAFVREPRDFVSHSVWALLTAAVVFEFSIGATLSRGFNRGLGTLTAGGLALAVAESAKNLGKMEEVIIVVSTFTVGFCTTLAKLHPKMKPYEYGFRVFLLTFGYVMVSGYSTGKFTDTAVNRFVFIALGAGVSLGINIGIYPIWAGEDLHNLVAKNFSGVANSLEGCVDEYLKCMEYERISSRILLYQASDDPLYSGYRAAVEASAQEQTLLDDAVWEPPHGPYKMMNYPWKAFTKVGGALRYCSFSAMALHGCILSEIQAPPESRKVFSSEIHRVGREGAKVLRELGNNVQTMTKLSSSDILFEVHLAAEELQKKIDEKSYLLVNTEAWYTSKRAEGINNAMNATLVVGKENKNEAMEPNIADQTLAYHYKTFAASSFRSRYDSSSTIDGHKKLPYWPARTSFHPNLPFEDTESKTYQSASALSLATFASLLIEFVARLQNVVYAFEELSVEANFKEPAEEPVAVSKSYGGFVAKMCKLVGLRS